MTHGSWIIAAVALGVLLIGGLAVPGGPVHHWLTCHIDSITDINGAGPNTNACTQTVESEPLSLLGSPSLTFTDTWASNDWEEMADSSTQSWPDQIGSYGLLANSTGVAEVANASTFNGTLGEQALVAYENVSATYTQFSFSGVSYNGALVTAVPVVYALVQSTSSSAITQDRVWSYDVNGYSQSTTPVTIALPAHTVGIAWGLIGGGTSNPLDDGWAFVLQNPTLTS